MGGLLFLSLLVMLNLPLVFTGFTGMDQYGFFTLDPLATQPLPLALSAAVNTALALLAYSGYSALRRQHTRYVPETWAPFKRYVLIIGVPVALAVAPSFFLTSYGSKPYYVVIAVLMTGSLCITTALRDGEIRLNINFAMYWFIVAVAIIVALLAMSITGLLVLYPMEQPAPSGNLLWTWSFDWADLGYPQEQFAQRQRDALMVFVLLGCGYMIVALGGPLLGSILRWTNGNSLVEQSYNISGTARPTLRDELPVAKDTVTARRAVIRLHLTRLADANGRALRDIDFDAAWAIAETDNIRAAASRMSARKHGVLTQGVDEKTVTNRANAILERTGLKENPGLQAGDLRGYLLALN